VKGSKGFIIIFSVLFILYIVAEINKPTPIDWSITLSKNDKNPYGGYIVYNQLKYIFPNANIQSTRKSFYQQLKSSEDDHNIVYFIVGDAFRPANSETNRMKNFVSKGNYIVASANLFYTPFLDSFGVETTTPVYLKAGDSTSLNFVNPALKDAKGYTFLKGTIDQHFSKIDTAKAVVLSSDNKGKPVYIKVPFGKGAFFLHADPLCFSNYFLLFKNNATYTSNALSYLPANTSTVYWDEYYKLGPEGPQTPFRFFLSNEYLRWALRLALIGLLLYVLFEMKRRQRVIPVITPLKNTTVEFIKTVASVYFNEKDNNGIAEKKINYFLEFIRNRFNLSTHVLDDDFVEQLQRKSGVERSEVIALVQLISSVPRHATISNQMLLTLDKSIHNFYKQV